jgi:hypothetical protein
MLYLTKSYSYKHVRQQLLNIAGNKFKASTGWINRFMKGQNLLLKEDVTVPEATYMISQKSYRFSLPCKKNAARKVVMKCFISSL